MNSKMIFAPLLAFVLALLIAGAVAPFWPHDQPYINPNPTPLPTNSGTYQPTQAPSAADLYFLPTILGFIGAAIIIVCLAVYLLYFRKEPK